MLQPASVASGSSGRLDFDRDGADWPNRAASGFVRAGGLRWHVQRAGSGPVALLLHGTGASTHSWAGLLPLLGRRFTVVAPDLPGHGFTDMADVSRMSLPGMTQSIADLLRELAVAPRLVVGHSAGAAIAIRMSIDRLVAPHSIVSINGALLPFKGIAGQIFSPLAKLLVVNPLVARMFAWRAGDKRAVARVLRGTGGEPDSRSLDYYARLFQNPGHVAGALAMMARWDLDTLARDLGKLESDLLLIAGTGDLAVSADDAFQVAKGVRNARVEVLRGSGHLVHEENPEAIGNIAIGFYDDVEQRRANWH